MEEEDIGGFLSSVSLCSVLMTLHSVYGAFSALGFSNLGPPSPCLACKLCRALGLTSETGT